MLIPLGNRDLVAIYIPSIGLLFEQQQYPEGAGPIVPGFVQTHNKRQLWLKKKKLQSKQTGQTVGFSWGEWQRDKPA